jgi:hypothetical protein
MGATVIPQTGYVNPGNGIPCAQVNYCQRGAGLLLQDARGDVLKLGA